MVTICATKESKEKITTSNVLYNSVKLVSTIDAIEKSLETMNCHLATIIPTGSTIHPTIKYVLHLVKSEIDNVSNYNTTLKQEIVPSLTIHASSNYAYKCILWEGRYPLSHVYCTLTQSPKKRNKYNQKDKTAIVSPSLKKKLILLLR